MPNCLEIQLAHVQIFQLASTQYSLRAALDMLVPFLVVGRLEIGCFSFVADLKRFMTSWDADQLTMLEEAWRCPNAAEHCRGIVAMNVNCGVADRFLE